MRIRELQATIADAERRKSDIQAAYSESINGWGYRHTNRYGQVSNVRRSDRITPGSAPDSPENKKRLSEIRMLEQQIAAMRAELGGHERALTSAQ